MAAGRLHRPKDKSMDWPFENRKFLIYGAEGRMGNEWGQS